MSNDRRAAIAIFCGIGGIGTNIAEAIAHYGRLTEDVELDGMIFIDPDTVEAKNMNRLPFKKYIGMHKVYALKEFIEENICNEIPIAVYPEIAQKAIPAIMDEFMYKDHNLIFIDATDSPIAQAFIYKTYEANKVMQANAQTDKMRTVHYIRIGNENEKVHIEIRRTVACEGFGEPPTGYISTQTNQFYVAGTVHIFWLALRLMLSNFAPHNIRADLKYLVYEIDVPGKRSTLFGPIFRSVEKSALTREQKELLRLSVKPADMPISKMKLELVGHVFPEAIYGPQTLSPAATAETEPEAEEETHDGD